MGKKKKRKKINWQIVSIIAALIGSIASLIGAIIALLAAITSGALSQALKSKILQLSSGSDPTTVAVIIAGVLLVIFTLLILKIIRYFSEKYMERIIERMKNGDRGL